MTDRDNIRPSSVQAAPFLEFALFFTIIAHAAAMVSMLLLLLPAMPGGAVTDIALRAGYVAHHPWLWRLGWFPWQVCALSDLILALALLQARWLPRFPAVITLIATIAGIVPDQTGQFLWTWVGPSVAEHAIGINDFAGYGRFESHVFHFIAGWGTVGYLAGALGWTWCFAAGGVWSKRLTWLSVSVWPIFALATAPLMLPAEIAQLPVILIAVSIGNAVAFILLMFWLLDVTALVMRRRRPDWGWRRYVRWRGGQHPLQMHAPRIDPPFDHQ